MNTQNLTISEEIVLKHLEYCNKVQQGFNKIEGDFPFNIGDIVYSDSQKRIIGIVFGFIYCPITKQNRIVLGVNCDVSFQLTRKATEKEERVFNIFTKDFNPVEARYCVWL